MGLLGSFFDFWSQFNAVKSFWHDMSAGSCVQVSLGLSDLPGPSNQLVTVVVFDGKARVQNIGSRSRTQATLGR